MLRPETEIGFHAHHNLAHGRRQLAGRRSRRARAASTARAAGLGAGAGNTPLEVFIAVADRMGSEHGVDLFALMDVAEDLSCR